MQPVFIGHPLAQALFLASLLAWALSELRQALRRRAEASSQDRGSLLMVRLSVFGGALLAAYALRVTAAALPPNGVVVDVTLGLIWVGIALRWWSFWTLGHYFTMTVMTSQQQRVVDSGPYRYLRHPSYAAMLLILGGIGLSFGNWLSLVALVMLPSLGFVNRILVEEAALTRALGDAYTSYASSRKRLLPFLW